MIVFFMQLLAVAIFTPMGWAVDAIEKEKAMIAQVMGSSGGRFISAEADDWHKTFIIDSGLYAGTVKMLIPTKKQKERSKGIERMGTAEGWFGWVQERIDTVSKVIHHTMMRVSMLKMWLPYILIILIPAAYDGLMTWKIKRTNFAYVSPVLHRYGARGVVLIAIIFLLLFFAPIAVHPIYIPVGLIAVCLLIGLMIGNTQKRI